MSFVILDISSLNQLLIRNVKRKRKTEQPKMNRTTINGGDQKKRNKNKSRPQSKNISMASGCFNDDTIDNYRYMDICRK